MYGDSWLEAAYEDRFRVEDEWNPYEGRWEWDEDDEDEPVDEEDE